MPRGGKKDTLDSSIQEAPTSTTPNDPPGKDVPDKANNNAGYTSVRHLMTDERILSALQQKGPVYGPAAFLAVDCQFLDHFVWSCQTHGCRDNFVCDRREYSTRSVYPECLPDPKAIVDARLNEWNSRWNARDFQGLEDFYTVDMKFLVPGREVHSGKDGFAEFISGLIAKNKWQNGTWSLVSSKPIGGDRIASVDLVEIQSTTESPTTFGKDIIVWRRVDDVYLIEFECVTFN